MHHFVEPKVATNQLVLTEPTSGPLDEALSRLSLPRYLLCGALGHPTNLNAFGRYLDLHVSTQYRHENLDSASGVGRRLYDSLPRDTNSPGRAPG
jgi:hypothetical protein